MNAELALLTREFVRLMPEAYEDFRIPDPQPRHKPPRGAGFFRRLLSPPAWRLLPTQ